MKIHLTDAMADAAYKAYDATDGHTAALLEAVRAVLDMIPEPELDVTTSAMIVDGIVGRQAALERAKEMVDAAAAPVPNARGYTDGWKPPTLEDRTTAILRLAAFMTGSAGEV